MELEKVVGDCANVVKWWNIIFENKKWKSFFTFLDVLTFLIFSNYSFRKF